MRVSSTYMVDYAEEADAVSCFPDLLSDSLTVVGIIAIHARDVDDWDRLIRA